MKPLASMTPEWTTARPYKHFTEMVPASSPIRVNCLWPQLLFFRPHPPPTFLVSFITPCKPRAVLPLPLILARSRLLCWDYTRLCSFGLTNPPLRSHAHLFGHIHLSLRSHPLLLEHTHPPLLLNHALPPCAVSYELYSRPPVIHVTSYWLIPDSPALKLSSSMSTNQTIAWRPRSLRMCHPESAHTSQPADASRSPGLSAVNTGLQSDCHTRCQFITTFGHADSSPYSLSHMIATSGTLIDCHTLPATPSLLLLRQKIATRFSQLIATQRAK